MTACINKAVRRRAASALLAIAACLAVSLVAWPDETWAEETRADAAPPETMIAPPAAETPTADPTRELDTRVGKEDAAERVTEQIDPQERAPNETTRDAAASNAPPSNGASLEPSAATTPPARSCHAPSPGGAPICIGEETFAEDLCRALQLNADANGLPRGFFARLIWRESLFDPGAVSHKGAQGVAQFMPGTAALRGLEDPFNPAAALAASAVYLAELRERFGNLGLAAAAYNAGEGWAERLSKGAPRGPAETEAYVAAITGVDLADWRDGEPKKADYRLKPGAAFLPSCVTLANERRLRPLRDAPARQPWGVEIGSHTSRAAAQRIFRRLQKRYPRFLASERPMYLRVRGWSGPQSKRYAIRVGRGTRREALHLCLRLQALGGACVVRETR